MTSQSEVYHVWPLLRESVSKPDRYWNLWPVRLAHGRNPQQVLAQILWVDSLPKPKYLQSTLPSQDFGRGRSVRKSFLPRSKTHSFACASCLYSRSRKTTQLCKPLR